MKVILAEALFVAAAGLIFALVGNALSPRGLQDGELLPLGGAETCSGAP